jgi:putative transposase
VYTVYMQLRYSFRIEPDRKQRDALAKVFGCARVVYNDAIAIRRKAYKEGLPYPSFGELCRTLITDAKRTPERAWLGEVSVVPLHQAMRDMERAYQNYFTSKSGKRKGPMIGLPRFKSRKDRHVSVRFTSGARWSITPSGALSLPKIGHVKVRWSRRLPSAPSSVTVIRDSSGRYFASFVVQTGEQCPPPGTNREVGIDLGLTHFAVLSDGTKISSPRFLRRAERKLRKANQALSRKEKGSANRKKAAARAAGVHAKVSDARRDFHHKLSTQIIRENQAVYVESLSVKGLARTRLAKSVYDAGWSRFVAMLEYKAALYRRDFGRVDRMFPSSQICSACGLKDGPKPLSVRIWRCQGCELTHDRDVNAARNIRAEGQRIVAAGHADTENACGAQVRPVLLPAPRSEAGTHPKQPPGSRRWEQAGIPGL